MESFTMENTTLKRTATARRLRSGRQYISDDYDKINAIRKSSVKTPPILESEGELSAADLVGSEEEIDDHLIKRSRTRDSSRKTFKDTAGGLGTNAQKQIAAFELSEIAGFRGPLEDNTSRNSSKQQGSKTRKKKVAQSDRVSSRGKALKGFYRNQYRQLLNKDVNDAVSQYSPVSKVQALSGSQIGMSRWTSAEKETFFSALTRLGKDNVRGISTRIGTKSELEVRQYLQLLHEGSVEHNDNGLPGQLFSKSDVPAAVQISDECCEVLERAADAMSLYQERHEESAERKRWGENWLLTREVDDWVQEQSQQDRGARLVEESLPAVSFFNLSNWLELSERLFMNPGSGFEAENWNHILCPDEEMGIRATALEDFRRLAVSITRRLVSAALFITMSRLRSMDPGVFQRLDHVGKADVEAAVKTLGLDMSSNEFWICCARRNHLEVHRNLQESLKNGQAMPYEEVEQIMSRQKSSVTVHTEIAGDDSSHELESDIDSLSYDDSGADSSPEEDPSSNVDSQLDDKSSTNAQNSPLQSPTIHTFRNLASEYLQLSTSTSQPLDPSSDEHTTLSARAHAVVARLAALKESERAQEEYVEALDMRNDLLEEKFMWEEVLDQEPPFDIRPEDVDVPKRPVGERADHEVVAAAAWRNKVGYAGMWEVFETPVPDEAFVRTRTGEDAL